MSEQSHSALMANSMISEKVYYVVMRTDTVSPVTFDVSESSSAGGSSNLRELLVLNCDLEQECMDSELRVALQWIAASELGLPVLYFRKSKEMRTAKVRTLTYTVSNGLLLY